MAAVPGVFADPYQDLQSGVNAFTPVIQMDLQQHAQDQLDTKLEAGDDFFPMSGSGAASSRPIVGEGGQFVSFKIDGVSYVLSDVPASQWFAPYVRDVADRGIVSGYRDANGVPTGIFGPERPVSIEELAKMAIGAAQINIGSGGVLPKNVGARQSWSKSYINTAERAGFAIYTDGSVDVTRSATRAEVVMTILQAFGVSLRDIPPADLAFTDVSSATLFAPAIFTALNDGVVSGFTDANGNLTGIFGPELPVNRAEVSKIISIAVQIYGGE
ncbi:hypothetical protein EXS70_00655 [Candidatus Peribacteria bacterium]|nr:hypothetical protein [Candidatus Peribacteria bacterium]